MRKLRKILGKIGYSFVYIAVSIASAYGVILISMDNMSGGNAEAPLPEQIEKIVENFSTAKTFDVDLSAKINSSSDKFTINLDAAVDMTHGLDNLETSGTLSVTKHPPLDEFVAPYSYDSNEDDSNKISINFNYQDEMVFIDMFNGKIAVQTDSLMQTLNSVMQVSGINLDEMGLGDISNMPIKEMLGMLKINKETKDTKNNQIALLMDIPVIGQATFICDNSYRLTGIVAENMPISDNMSITINSDLGYPKDLEIEQKNQDDYVNIGNLLTVAQPFINYINQDEFAVDLSVQQILDDGERSSILDGTLSLDKADKNAMLGLNAFNQTANIHLIDKALYLEFRNIFTKFNLTDIEKVNDFAKNSFNLSIPQDVIDTLLNIINGKQIELPSGVSLDTLNPSTFDLSIVENVIVKGNSTIVSIRDIGIIRITTKNDSLSEIAYSGFGYEIVAKILKFSDFALTEEQENYIDITSFLPTAENVIDIISCDTIKGYAQVDGITINYLYSKSNNYANISTVLYGVDVNIDYLNNNFFVNIADKFKFVADSRTLADEILSLMTELGVSTNQNGSSKIFDKIALLLDPASTPLFITDFIKTENGFELTLFNDTVVAVANTSSQIDLSTKIAGKEIDVVVAGSDEFIQLPVINNEEYTTTETIFDLIVALYNTGIHNLITPALNTFTSENIGLNINISYQEITFNGEINISLKDKTLSLVSEVNNTALKLFYQNSVIYLEYGNVMVKFDTVDIDKVDQFLSENFGIKLPTQTIAKAIDLLNGQTPSVDEILNNINFNLADLDLAFFDNITVLDNSTTIKLPVGTFVINNNSENILGFTFSGNGLNVNATLTPFENINLSTEVASYIDITSFIPTVENALDIISCDNITGYAQVDDIVVNFVYSKSNEFANVSTSIYDYPITINYINDKVYTTVADKFKFVTNTTSFVDDIKSFLESIGVNTEINVEGESILSKIADIINPASTPLLITSMIETENGFTITLYNGLSLTLTNETNKVSITTTVDSYNISAVILGNNNEVVVPQINEEEYTDTNIVLNLLSAIYNSNILDLATPAYNTFKSGLIGLEFTFDYDENVVSGTISIDVNTLTIGISADIKGIPLNITAIDNIAYVEFGNLFFKFALDDTKEIGKLLEKHFNIVIPFEEYINIINDLKSGLTDPKAFLDNFEFNIDLASIDLTLFQNIVAENGTYIIPFTNAGDLTITSSDDLINKISFAGFGFNLSANITSYTAPQTTIEKESFVNLTDILPTVDNVLDIVKYDTLSGQITIDDGKLNVPIDYIISKSGEVYAEFKTQIYGANISARYYKTKLYLEFAESVKLVVDINKMPSVFKELLTSAGKNLPDGGLFNAIDSYLNSLVNSDTSDMVSTIIDSFDSIKSIFDPTNIEMLIKSLVETDNSLKIKLFNDMLINIINNNDVINGSTSIDEVAVDFSLIGSNQAVTIPTINDNDFTPLENVLELVKAFLNMTHKDDFNIQGAINVKLELLGIEGVINMNIPVNAQVKVVDGKTEFQAVIGEIPAVLGVNNDVPFKTGDTESGSDRMLYIYYTDGDIYLYRHEYVDIFFGASKRSYEKCTKIAAATFIENPMYYLQYGIGFSDSIMSAINDAMELSKNREGNINLNNVVNDFSSNGDNFNIVLNLTEIANNPQLGDLSLNLGLNYDADDKSYIHTLGLNVSMPFTDGVKMDLASNGLSIVDYGKPVDLSRLKEYVSNYKYDYNQEWEASNGDWKKASEVLYTIYFEENGGSQVADISVVYKQPITLPTLPSRVVDDGSTQNTYTFAGWYTDPEFKEKSRFTSTTMPRKDTTLYAKWDCRTKYYYTVSFVSEHNVSFSSIKALEGSIINLPTYSNTIIEDDGIGEHSFTFAGWYSDPSFDEASRFISAYMPSQNTTLYAKWNCSTIYYRTISFNSMGSNDVVASIKALAGTEISIPNINSNWIVDDGITKNTKTFDSWWTSPNYSDGTKFVSSNMPDQDLTLYAKWNDHIEYYRTIRFITEDKNTTVNSITQLEGTAIDIPALVSKTETIDGLNYVYNFGGWYTEIELQNVFTETIMPLKDTVLYAKWVLAEAPKTLTVYHNGKEIYQTQISQGMSFSLNNIASLPSDTRYYLDPDFTNEYTSFVMEEDIILYARVKYTLTVTNSFGSAQTYTDYQGATIKYVTPTTPATYDDGKVQIIYSFGGYSESFTAMPSENKTICVVWNEKVTNYRTIKFVSNYNQVSFNSITQLEGSTLPTLPTTQVVWVVKDDGKTERVTRTFAGWYTNSSLTTAFNSTVMPSTDTTLYAKWNEITKHYYTITFDKAENVTGGYEEYIVFSHSQATFLEGTEVDLTQFTASWEYYAWWDDRYHEFYGWCYDVPTETLNANIKKHLIANQKIVINSNVTLYAAWSNDVKTR